MILKTFPCCSKKASHINTENAKNNLFIILYKQIISSIVGLVYTNVQPCDRFCNCATAANFPTTDYNVAGRVCTKMQLAVLSTVLNTVVQFTAVSNTCLSFFYLYLSLPCFWQCVTVNCYHSQPSHAGPALAEYRHLWQWQPTAVWRRAVVLPQHDVHSPAYTVC